MALTLDSKLKEIMKHPEAVAVLDKYNPGFADNKQLKMCYGMSFKALCKFPQAGMYKDHMDEIEKVFASVED